MDSNIERRSSTRITQSATTTTTATSTQAAATPLLKVKKNMTTPPPTFSYTNTAKLPIDVVKQLISAVERRPNLWLRNNTHGQQKRCDITPLWYEVSKDVNLPVDICRIKWGHLRDNFRKVYIRNNLTGATPTSWRFYNDMKFMENPVAENIVNQSRGRRKSAYFQSQSTNNHSNNTSINGIYNYHKKEFADLVMPICELTEGGYDCDNMHQPSFSDISTFFDESHHGPALKRIKFEDKDIMNGDYTTQDEQQSSNENDDDFDEDAATDENDQEQITENFGERKSTTGAFNGLFTIEVPDDDDDDDDDDADDEGNNQMKLNLDNCNSNPVQERNNNNNNSNCSNNSNNRLPFKNITVDATTNTDSNLGESSENADRMFLLSMLPFMSKIDERRKLQVRQKLQNVLIEEFG